jgi:hypothetical protein
MIPASVHTFATFMLEITATQPSPPSLPNLACYIKDSGLDGKTVFDGFGRRRSKGKGSFRNHSKIDLPPNRVCVPFSG